VVVLVLVGGRVGLLDEVVVEELVCEFEEVEVVAGVADGVAEEAAKKAQVVVAVAL